MKAIDKKLLQALELQRQEETDEVLKRDIRYGIFYLKRAIERKAALTKKAAKKESVARAAREEDILLKELHARRAKMKVPADRK